MKTLLTDCDITTADAFDRLVQLGVTKLEELMKRVANPTSFSALARESGLDEKSLRKIVGRADLSRLSALNAKELELLQAAGIESLQNLARNEPAKLLNWIREVNDEARVVRRVPALERVTEWIAGAKYVTAQANF